PGADRMLFDYEALIGYLQKLEAASPRLKLVEIGKSPMGKKMYIAFFSSEENIKNLDKLKEINRSLALDADIPEQERETLIKDGRVFFLATLSMHSDEVGSSQAAPLIAYQLVTTWDAAVLEWLDNVVYMMNPNNNPDGMNMVVDYYNKSKDTKYEGTSMPGVYHKYVGHDNNRDYVTLTQEDNKAIAAAYNLEWFPQVMVEKHQMGSGTVRYTVPQAHDPIAENIDAGIWNWTGIFGSNMITDMTKKGLAGVAQRYIFDEYWPGATTTCLWKNVITFLTEAASAQYAKPIFIESNELGAYGKGLAEYKKSINMPLPWPGGWWRLSDIVDYEVVSTMSIIKTASLHREAILTFRGDLCKKEVNNGKTKPPYYYVMPKQQHDRSELVNLVNLLKEHGVAVYRLTKDREIEKRNFKKGDIVVPLAQAYRPFIKEIMERQEYPVRHYTPGGKIIQPYENTSWSLPLHRGVAAVEVNTPVKGLTDQLEKIEGTYSMLTEVPGNFWAAIFNVNENESYKAAFLAVKLGLKVERLQKCITVNEVKIPCGSFVVYYDGKKVSKVKKLLAELHVSPVYVKEAIKFETLPLKIPRIALVETYFHDMDAGWTRYICDTYHIPFKVIRPGDFEKTDFVKNFDVVLFPDMNKSVLQKGKWKGGERYYVASYPPEYTKGIGKKGMERLMTFFAAGGIIVSWGQSTGLFLEDLEIVTGKDVKEEFQLPAEDISGKLRKAGLYCPGSFVRAEFLPGHPLTRGMKSQGGIYFGGRPIFSTYIPDLDMDRRVIAKFPGKDILLSGYCEKEEKLANRSVLVWLKKGKGQVVLSGFNPLFRASTQATFKVLFNAILLPKLK
ncbi:M14 family zinc carboxypeptidase, partial [Acidobacteriota bacterium]